MNILSETTESGTLPNIYPMGDDAVTVLYGNGIKEEWYQQALGLYNSLLHNRELWIKDIILAYASVTVVYNARQILKLHRSPSCFVQQWLMQQACSGNLSKQQGRHTTIPVCYHPHLAPDLFTVAKARLLTLDQFIRLHSNRLYMVYMLGFLPGFAYLGKLHPQLFFPRRRTPHARVEAGSVAIAGNQTGIYPFESPGGWHIVGKTPLNMFDPTKDQPCLLQHGDTVRFKPISLKQFENLAP